MLSWSLIDKTNLEISPETKIFKFNIFYQRVKRFFKVALLLHLTALCGLALFFWFARMMLSALEQYQTFNFFLYGSIAGYGLIFFFFAQLDAYSRYQNYKKAKDLFYKNGFKTRIVNLFINSLCQRDAIKVAALDLGFQKELCRYYQQQGYKWFHVLPDFIFYRPSIVFTINYWEKTLFTKKYKSKYFLW